ncbi:hypothetical protein CPB85DRAFT_13959 [Mucidula mucida]|nr:hypothetical protein CPB85DRAFT_13959 [Mucidula mucida]
MQNQPNERFRYTREQRAEIRFRYQSGVGRTELQDDYKLSTAVLWAICENAASSYGDNVEDDKNILSKKYGVDTEDVTMGSPEQRETTPQRDNDIEVETINISDDEEDISSTRGQAISAYGKVSLSDRNTLLGISENGQLLPPSVCGARSVLENGPRRKSSTSCLVLQLAPRCSSRRMKSSTFRPALSALQLAVHCLLRLSNLTTLRCQSLEIVPLQLRLRSS